MGGSGSAPKPPPQSQYEVAIEKAMADFYTGTMPGQTGAGQYQIALETGQGLHPGIGMAPGPAAAPGAGGAAPEGMMGWAPKTGQEYFAGQAGAGLGRAYQRPTDWRVEGTAGTPGAKYYQMAPLAGQAGAIGQAPGTTPAGGLPAPGAAGAGLPEWQKNIQGRGGLMGIRSQIASGQARPGEPGSQYGSGIELERELGGVQQYLQNRGLMPRGGTSGLMLEMGSKRGADIAERNEQRRRQEQMALLGTGG